MSTGMAELQVLHRKTVRADKQNEFLSSRLRRRLLRKKVDDNGARWRHLVANV